MRYDWPGNVRELRSTFEYAFVTCREETIRPEDLPPSIQHYLRPSTPNVVVAPSPIDRNMRQKQELLDALSASGGNQLHAAAILGVSRVTVWNRMKRFGKRSERQVM